MAADLCACPDLSCNIATANRLPWCLQVKFNNGEKKKQERIKKKQKNKPTLKWERSPRLVFIGVCHSACLLAASRLSLFLTAFSHQASLLRPWFASFCLFYILLPAFFSSHPAAPGRQLEAVEGPPDVPGLHRDENPTGGSPVQPEETMAGEPKRRPPLERFGCGAAWDVIRVERVSRELVFIDMPFVCSCASMNQCICLSHCNIWTPVSDSNLLPVVQQWQLWKISSSLDCLAPRSRSYLLHCFYHFKYNCNFTGFGCEPDDKSEHICIQVNWKQEMYFSPFFLSFITLFIFFSLQASAKF